MSHRDPSRQVHFQQTDPGVSFTKDPWIAIDLDHPLDSERILTPNVIHLPSGGYRMYYTGLGPGRRDTHALGYILSATADDAETWTKDPEVRVDLFEPHASLRTLCPDVIPLPEGGYRMYFEARSPDQPTVVLSARSDDGLDWTVEDGVRFGDGTWSYGTPRVLPLHGSNGYRMYFHRYTFPLLSGPEPGNHIISALSSDGLHFEEDPGVRIVQETDREMFSVYAPEVIRLADDTYRMYYSGWSDTVRGGIFSATSEDGLAWKKTDVTVIELGGQWDGDMVSEPCIIDLPDGRSRLFYEACDDDDNYRILSATSDFSSTAGDSGSSHA
ncbi:MAG: hypothetical protein VX255_09140 [Candidatus Latescibacterota bacterium]|nr:hypothetical protein [Candidatus Latescibacterota bacterium]